MSLRKCLIAGAAAVGMALPTAAAAQVLAQATTDLNLRTQPGGQIITTMPRGAQVVVHQCPGSWCQVSYGGVTGWASHRYLSGAVAVQPRTRTYAVAPQPRVTLGFEVGPRYRYYAPRYRYGSRFHRWNDPPPDWYEDGVFDRDWYYDDDWDIGPSAGFSLRFGR